MEIALNNMLILLNEQIPLTPFSKGGICPKKQSNKNRESLKQRTAFHAI